jgi:multidrug resistance efflux pump
MLHARALAQETFDDAAADVLNQLALLLHCDRVSLGLRDKGKLQVVAVSGSGEASRRNTQLLRIAAAMNESLEQRSPIVHPLPSGSTPAVTVAHRALAEGSGAVLTMPVATRHEWFGALLFERRDAFDRVTVEAAKDAAMFVGPVLALKHRFEATMGERVTRALGGTSKTGPFALRRMPVRRALAAAGVLALALLAFVPVTHRIAAPAHVEGSVQQVIAAPFEGFVGSVAVRPGDSITRGQVLATLDTRELELERDQWAAEIAQLDKQYREALSRDDAAPIVTTRAKLDAARSRHEFALQQMERATLRAPMDGVVLSGDLTQAVGTPTQRGQELMTIAPDRGLRIVAEVDERDIGHVREGQQAQALFAAIAGNNALTFDVARIAPVASTVDGRNVFDVEGAPAQGGDPLRPGMRGVVRIDVGTQPLAWTWWTRLAHAARRTAWQLGS